MKSKIKIEWSQLKYHLVVKLSTNEWISRYISRLTLFFPLHFQRAVQSSSARYSALLLLSLSPLPLLQSNWNKHSGPVERSLSRSVFSESDHHPSLWLSSRTSRSTQEVRSHHLSLFQLHPPTRVSSHCTTSYPSARIWDSDQWAHYSMLLWCSLWCLYQSILIRVDTRRHTQTHADIRRHQDTQTHTDRACNAP